MAKLKAGVIGLGMGWGHLAGYMSHPDVEVVAIADRREERRERAKKEYNPPKIYTEGIDMIRNEKLDILSVAVPNNQHKDLTIAGLEAGANVLCEKPMAMNTAEAQEMLDTAKKLKLKLGIDFSYRFNPQSRAMKDLVEAGKLGNIYYARSVWLRRRGVPGLASGFNTSGSGPMALYLGDQADHTFAFYQSTDLLHWEMTDRHPFAVLPERECPGFIRLPVVGEPGVERHIFLGANGIYWIGDFDGEGFLTESGPHFLFVRSGGNCLYAGQSWFNSADNRQLYLAWQQGDNGSKVFSQTMSIPVELKLRRFPEGLRLTANPVRELETLSSWCREFSEIAIDNARVPALSTGIPEDDAWDLEFEVADHSNLSLVICGNDFAFDAGKRVIRFCAAEFALPEDADFKVRILVDRNSYELFVSDGRIWYGKRLRNRPDRPLLAPGQLCGKGVLRNVKLRQVQSVWR